MSREKEVDRCIKFIQQQIDQQHLRYAQHTAEFAAAIEIGLEAGIKQANGEFAINTEEEPKPRKSKKFMSLITKYFSSSILVVSLFFITACNDNTSSVRPNQLSSDYVKCESKLTGDTFKYTTKVIYPEAFCVNQQCVDIYEITDLDGTRIILNEHELRDEWVCSIINN